MCQLRRWPLWSCADLFRIGESSRVPVAWTSARGRSWYVPGCSMRPETDKRTSMAAWTCELHWWRYGAARISSGSEGAATCRVARASAQEALLVCRGCKTICLYIGRA
ncbi:hypothetical protein [Paenibacillus xylanilyticus]|uniref:Uncharacterized protein n=1 Tax=Paenibacillus xylanilyticus TaxID=248903 RepID=A0A7Y6C4K2_9BACL|nr:hypothetical protein [Paenibacillus xylanilyticus]NUU79715.1 hypothetical protein [Paenibacillus xylanilyticus]